MVTFKYLVIRVTGNLVFIVNKLVQRQTTVWYCFIYSQNWLRLKFQNIMKAFGLSIIRTKQIILYPLKWFSLRLFNNKSNCLLNDGCGWMWNSNFCVVLKIAELHSTMENPTLSFMNWAWFKTIVLELNALFLWDNFAKASSALPNCLSNWDKKSSVFWMKITVFSEI
jgi:hypothetical protein